MKGVVSIFLAGIVLLLAACNKSDSPYTNNPTDTLTCVNNADDARNCLAGEYYGMEIFYLRTDFNQLEFTDTLYKAFQVDKPTAQDTSKTILVEDVGKQLDHLVEFEDLIQPGGQQLAELLYGQEQTTDTTLSTVQAKFYPQNDSLLFEVKKTAPGTFLHRRFYGIRQ